MAEISAVSCVDGFRAALRRMACTVSVVTTIDDVAIRHGMTATSVTSLSFDPPSLLVCVKRSASIYRPLRRSRAFCVNVLRDGQADIARAFSGVLKGEERFAVGSWESDPVGAVCLADAVAIIHCRLEKVTTFGSHAVYIGRVERVRLGDDFRPLVYRDGQYVAIAADAAMSLRASSNVSNQS